MIKRKMLAIVLAITMVFTFSFGAVGAYATGDVQTASTHDYKITAIHWNDDYTEAIYDVVCQDEGCGETAQLEAEVRTSYYNSWGHYSTVYISKLNDIKNYKVASGVDTSSVDVLNLDGAKVEFENHNIIDGNQLCASGFDWNDIEKKLTVVNVNDSTKTITDNDYHHYNDLTKVIPFEYKPYDDGVYQVSIVSADNTGNVKVIGSTTADITVKTSTLQKDLITFDVSGLDTYTTTFTYDGEPHTVSITNPGLTVKYGIADANGKVEYTTTPPVIKNVGSYHIYFRATLNGTANYEDFDFIYTINPAEATITPVGTTTKVYDGTGFTLKDNLFEVKGEVGDEILLTGVKNTGSDVGTYKIYPVIDEAVAKNYNVKIVDPGYTTGTIEKADNNITITKTTYSIKKGKSTTIKATTTFGTPTFQKVSGNSKISVNKSGVIKVKKSTKKGTYKVKVKAVVAKTNNYDRDSITTTLAVKVK